MKTTIIAVLALLLASVASAQQTSVRVHAGGTVFTDATGKVWQADTGLFNTGTLSGCATNATFTGAPDPNLYKSQRYGATSNPEMTYTLTGLANGTYTVNLYFAEPCAYVVGQRIFGVTLQGQAVLSNFDIVAAAGGARKAVIKKFTATVTAGTLSVVFTHGTKDNPMIAAIEAVQADVTPPTIQFTSPMPGSNFTTAVPVSLTVTDDTAVGSVSATLDGQSLGTPAVSGSSYTFGTDLTKIPLGAHVLKATAVDTSGNTSSATLSFTTAMTINLVAAATPHSVMLTWAASSSAVAGYNILRSTTDGSGYVQINSALISGLSFTDGNVESGQTYFYVAVSVDANGNQSGFSNQVSAAIPLETVNDCNSCVVVADK